MKTSKLVLAGAALAATLAMAPVSSASASQNLLASIASVAETANPNVTKAQYGYCRRWYRECRYRWGGGWRFRRCLAIRGCL